MKRSLLSPFRIYHACTALLSTCCLLAGSTLTAQQVTLQEQGNIVTLSNELITVGFHKTNADLLSIRDKKGNDLLGRKGRAYLLGPGFSMSPAQYKVVRQSNELIELSFFHEAENHFQYDLHYVLRNGVSGVYCFLVQSHRAGDSAGSYGQTRWGVRSDESLYDYHLVRDSIQGPMPKMSELTNEIQDWTYRLADSSVYTKYDYADYIEGRHVHGMAGRQSGRGMFVIQASHEYLNGGPSKQYQNVHSTPYLICMFNCNHFISDISKSDDLITGEWSKLNGPFLLYVNQGSNVNAIWKDAQQQAAKEINQWPYAWMQHARYPLARGAVQGKLLVDNQPAAAGTHIILAAPGYDWQAQSQGYIFATRTAADGSFTLQQVRPGNYTLYAYGSNQTGEFNKANVVVNAGNTTALGTLTWPIERTGTTLFQLGEADRRTTGFALAGHARNYGVFKQVPENLDFTIGKSRENKDWYYAQTKNGKWNIHFDTDKTYTGNAVLTIALAGAARNPLFTVYVNDQPVQEFNRLGNDASVYRSAIAGGYYQELSVRFPASLLKKGANTISFVLKAKPGAGVMYDAVKLEAAEDMTAVMQVQPIAFNKKTLLFSDDFSKGLDTAIWKSEIAAQPNSSVYVKDGQLILDTKGGVTTWLKKILSGNILIEYKRRVIAESGVNDRVSDLNQFWMATDPRNPHLFTRNGVFEAYDSLQLYYVGMGGNTNSTTRFRKYHGNGQKPLLQEYLDKTHLLQPNKTYTVQTVVYNGATQFIVDGIPYFTWKDSSPLTSGYFGFRSTWSRQAIDEVKVYSIE
ncbi:hypothetical protein HB364_09335 [Pseudoflavitalea sp. X16]|uniref:DUF6250 domain-containing protein n=1 Tax=Paraflavitalea devenefica TaxID=2716334 RepID=UPI00142242DA|nr:DUF6250 domain-containing protein [Paraflavitalea devenefica]NII25283.1 hypothetical protein [Paraflavitalea devenefica]